MPEKILPPSGIFGPKHAMYFHFEYKVSHSLRKILFFKEVTA